MQLNTLKGSTVDVCIKCMKVWETSGRVGDIRSKAFVYITIPNTLLVLHGFRNYTRRGLLRAPQGGKKQLIMRTMLPSQLGMQSQHYTDNWVGIYKYSKTTKPPEGESSNS